MGTVRGFLRREGAKAVLVILFLLAIITTVAGAGASKFCEKHFLATLEKSSKFPKGAFATDNCLIWVFYFFLKKKKCYCVKTDKKAALVRHR